MSHSSIIEFNYWACEQRRYDIVLIEEAARFPSKLFEDALKDTHTIVYAIFSGCDLGEPKMRKRFRGAAIRTERLLWLEPRSGNVTEERSPTVVLVARLRAVLISLVSLSLWVTLDDICCFRFVDCEMCVSVGFPWRAFNGCRSITPLPHEYMS